MKLDTRTTQILKNFATINPSMVFKPGSTLSTISPSKTILARATVDQEFDSTFGIGDLSRFLSTISLFENPTMEVSESAMLIKGNGRKITYRFTSLDVIMAPPEKEIKFPAAEVSFRLEGVEFQEAMKALSVLNLPEVAVIGDGKSVKLQVIDSKNTSADNYSVTVGETSDTFKMIFLAENLKVIPGSYDVMISSKGLSKFSSEGLEYYIAVESNSSFG
jgi:hypothetical protein